MVPILSLLEICLCFQVGDDSQEDPIELEKKELREEANPKNKWLVDCAQKAVVDNR